MNNREFLIISMIFLVVGVSFPVPITGPQFNYSEYFINKQSHSAFFPYGQPYSKAIDGISSLQNGSYYGKFEPDVRCTIPFTPDKVINGYAVKFSSSLNSFEVFDTVNCTNVGTLNLNYNINDWAVAWIDDKPLLYTMSNDLILRSYKLNDLSLFTQSSGLFNSYYDIGFKHKVEYKVTNNTRYYMININTKYLINNGLLDNDGNNILIVDDKVRQLLDWYVVPGTWDTEDTQIVVKLLPNTKIFGLYFDMSDVSFNFIGTFDNFIASPPTQEKVEGYGYDQHLHVYNDVSKFKNYTTVQFTASDNENRSAVIFDVLSTNPLYNHINDLAIYLDYNKLIDGDNNTYPKDLYYYTTKINNVYKFVVILPNNITSGNHELFIFYNYTGYNNPKHNSQYNNKLYDYSYVNYRTSDRIDYESIYTKQLNNTYNYNVFIFNGGDAFSDAGCENSGGSGYVEILSNNIKFKLATHVSNSRHYRDIYFYVGSNMLHLFHDEYTCSHSYWGSVGINHYLVVQHNTHFDIYWDGTGASNNNYYNQYDVSSVPSSTKLGVYIVSHNSNANEQEVWNGNFFTLVFDNIYDGSLGSSNANNYTYEIIYNNKVSVNLNNYDYASLNILNNSKYGGVNIILYDNNRNTLKYKTNMSGTINIDNNNWSGNGDKSNIKGMALIINSSDVNINYIKFVKKDINYYQELNNGFGITAYEYNGTNLVNTETIQNVDLSWNKSIDGYDNLELKGYLYPKDGTGNYTFKFITENGDYVNVSGNTTTEINITSNDYRLIPLDIKYLDNNSNEVGSLKIELYKDGSYIGTLNSSYTVPDSSNVTQTSNVDLDFAIGRFDNNGIDEILYISGNKIYKYDATTCNLISYFNMFTYIINYDQWMYSLSSNIIGNKYGEVYFELVIWEIGGDHRIRIFEYGKTIKLVGPNINNYPSGRWFITPNTIGINYNGGEKWFYIYNIPSLSHEYDKEFSSPTIVSDTCSIATRWSNGPEAYYFCDGGGWNWDRHLYTREVMHGPGGYYASGTINYDNGNYYHGTEVCGSINNLIKHEYCNVFDSYTGNIFVGRLSGNKSIYLYVGNRVYNLSRKDVIKDYISNLPNPSSCDYIIDADMDGKLDCIKDNNIYSLSNANKFASVIYRQQYSVHVGENVPMIADVTYTNKYVSQFDKNDTYYSTIYLPGLMNGTTPVIVKQGTYSELYNYAKVINNTLFFLPTIPSLGCMEYQINYYATPVHMIKSEQIQNNNYKLYMNFTGDNELNYFGIIADVPVPETIYYPHLFYYDNGWVDVSNNPSFNFQSIDDNHNGLIDHIKFILPSVKHNKTERYMLQAIYSNPVVCDITKKVLVNAPITASQYAYWNWTVVCKNPNDFGVNFDSKVTLPLKSSEVMLDNNLTTPKTEAGGYYINILGYLDSHKNITHYITFKTPPITVIPSYYYPNKYYINEKGQVDIKLDVRNWATEPMPNVHISLPLIYGENIKVYDQNNTLIQTFGQVSGILDFVVPVIQSQEAQEYTIRYNIPIGTSLYPVSPTTTIINGTQYIVKYIKIQSQTPVPIKQNIYLKEMDIPCNNVSKVIQVNSFSSDFGDSLEFTCNGTKTIINLGSLEVGQNKLIKIYYKGVLPPHKISSISNATQSVKNSMSNFVNNYNSMWKNIFEKDLHVKYNLSAKAIAWLTPLLIIGLIYKIIIVIPK